MRHRQGGHWCASGVAHVLAELSERGELSPEQLADTAAELDTGMRHAVAHVMESLRGFGKSSPDRHLIGGIRRRVDGSRWRGVGRTGR